MQYLWTYPPPIGYTGPFWGFENMVTGSTLHWLGVQIRFWGCRDACNDFRAPISKTKGKTLIHVHSDYPELLR